MLDHVLVTVTPGHAGEYARAMQAAKALLNSGGKISALTVLEEVPPYAGINIPPELLENHIEETKEELTSEFNDEGVESAVVVGHAANTILDWSEKNDVDCIVISSHQPGLSDYFLGSTAARVVRHAKCSVHVVR